MVAAPLSTPKATTEWRQGDCVVGSQEFIYRINPAHPLASASVEAIAIDPSTEAVSQEVEGLMLISQSCDIVRAPDQRPYVEVAPLVTLGESNFREVILGARPQYVTVSTLHSFKLAADLDRVMTIEKSLLSVWQRHPGCVSDSERRLLGKQLARKRYRAALPDEFAMWFKPLRNRFLRLASSGASDALVFRDLEEIRIQASPSWDASKINIFIWFILSDGAPERDRSEVLSGWLEKLQPRDQFVGCEGRIVRYMDISGAEYIDSDPLDLDHMSPEA